jgi:hypothetical protein
MAKPNQTNYERAFLFGGISGCGATLVLHPMDVIRVQIQIDGTFFVLIIHLLYFSISHYIVNNNYDNINNNNN